MASRKDTEPLLFRIVAAEARVRECLTRLPFRFGVVTMRGAPLAVLRVEIEFAGGDRSEGFSSDLLVPRWFEKTPGQTIAEDWRRLVRGIRDAGAAATADTILASAFDHWLRLDTQLVLGWNGDRSTRLLLSEGVSLVERALIDAVCRHIGRPFHEVIRSGAAGFRSAPFGLETHPSAVIRPVPRARMFVRHTVGLVDAIRAAEAGPNAPDDGLPTSLETAIADQGLVYFKLKVSGDTNADLDRLARIARLLRETRGDEALCTLDGNEQFPSIASLADLLARMGAADDTDWLRSRIAYIEQPVSRARTLDRDSAAGIRDLGLPVIIDESDADREVFAEAAALGYRGVSVKNCKGVFRAIAAAMRCEASAGRLFQSAEDLTNIPIMALHQDLATASALGLSHVERNGHHYFAGLGHLSDADRRGLFGAHGDLYESGGPGGGRVAIRDGGIDIASLHRTAGYAYAGVPDLRDWTPIEAWSPEGLLSRIESAGGEA